MRHRAPAQRPPCGLNNESVTEHPRPCPAKSAGRRRMARPCARSGRRAGRRCAVRGGSGAGIQHGPVHCVLSAGRGLPRSSGSGSGPVRGAVESRPGPAWRMCCPTTGRSYCPAMWPRRRPLSSASRRATARRGRLRSSGGTATATTCLRRSSALFLPSGPAFGCSPAWSRPTPLAAGVNEQIRRPPSTPPSFDR